MYNGDGKVYQTLPPRTVEESRQRLEQQWEEEFKNHPRMDFVTTKEMDVRYGQDITHQVYTLSLHKIGTDAEDNKKILLNKNYRRAEKVFRKVDELIKIGKTPQEIYDTVDEYAKTLEWDN